MILRRAELPGRTLGNLGGYDMAKAGRRDLIRLNSTAGTGYFYTTSKKKGAEKMVLKKYDPKVRKHVEFKEGKIK